MRMSEKALEARRKYRREYYQTHKEQAKKHQADYWERKAREQDAKQHQ